MAHKKWVDDGEEEWPCKRFTTKPGSDSNFSGNLSNVSSLEDSQQASSSFSESLSLKAGELDYVSEYLMDDYNCPVCLSLMNEPQLTSCGHHFCKACIEPIYQQLERECPLCKEPGFRMMPDRDIARKIRGLKIYCVNHQAGCEWTGEVANLEDHLLKRCGHHLVNCKFEAFGCTEKMPRRHQAVHISNTIRSHMTMVLEQFEAQQKLYNAQLSEKDAKISQLEQRINDFEATITSELERKSDIKWMPLHPWYEIYVINDKTPMGVKQRYVPENIVPRGAKEILILLAIHTQFSSPNTTSCISVFVEEDGVRYSKFIKAQIYWQRAWNDNTDNVWLPMPTDRVVNVDVPVQCGGTFCCEVRLIGYR